MRRFPDEFAGGYVQGSLLGENSPGTVKVYKSLSQRREAGAHGRTPESYLAFLEAGNDQTTAGFNTSTWRCGVDAR